MCAVYTRRIAVSLLSSLSVVYALYILTSIKFLKQVLLPKASRMALRLWRSSWHYSGAVPLSLTLTSTEERGVEHAENPETLNWLGFQRMRNLSFDIRWHSLL